ncbi:MAG: hypothetical protein COB67_06675 [SAR324 cluster bacterium]|uniref:Pili assembly chaperone N-terminal domain-containing protein n=1 Tax=SAR324 cluster bacterium TaxID=2024889 RepID=A0A2A4T4X1_9DELT|nr:MAG: hypothetical protein COB67_06675 [SAR324 cluster bacterium]
MNRFCLLWLWLTLLVTSPVMGKAFFSVAPGVVQFEFSRLRTQSFMISNTGDERVRLVIRPVYFAVDSRSLRAGTPLNPDRKVQDNISSSLVISPRVLSLAPNQRRKVRVSLRPQKQLRQGDYRAHLLISVLKGKSGRVNPPITTTTGLAINLDIQMETAVAVYARMGKAVYDFHWDCSKNSQNQLIVTAINPNQWRFKGWVGIFTPESTVKTPPLTLVRLISLRESKRPLLTELPAENSVRIRWGLDKEQLNMGSVNCNL